MTIPLRSVLEGKEACNTSSDPLGLGLAARQLNIEDVVSGVTSRRQSTITDQGLVDWAVVDA